jgi:DNA polymerase V
MKSVDIFCFSHQSHEHFPFFIESVKAGFPSQADDYIEKQLDFNEYLVRHPSATFCVKVSGDSMINAGIFPGDILVVDRALNAVNNSIVIAVVNAEFTVKRIRFDHGKISLLPENPAYSPIHIDNENFEIWGVVTYVIHKAK